MSSSSLALINVAKVQALEEETGDFTRKKAPATTTSATHTESSSQTTDSKRQSEKSSRDDSEGADSGGERSKKLKTESG